MGEGGKCSARGAAAVWSCILSQTHYCCPLTRASCLHCCQPRSHSTHFTPVRRRRADHMQLRLASWSPSRRTRSSISNSGRRSHVLEVIGGVRANRRWSLEAFMHLKFIKQLKTIPDRVSSLRQSQKSSLQASSVLDQVSSDSVWVLVASSDSASQLILSVTGKRRTVASRDMRSPVVVSAVVCAVPCSCVLFPVLSGWSDETVKAESQQAWAHRRVTYTHVPVTELLLHTGWGQQLRSFRWWCWIFLWAPHNYLLTAYGLIWTTGEQGGFRGLGGPYMHLGVSWEGFQPWWGRAAVAMARGFPPDVYAWTLEVDLLLRCLCERGGRSVPTHQLSAQSRALQVSFASAQGKKTKSQVRAPISTKRLPAVTPWHLRFRLCWMS